MRRPTPRASFTLLVFGEGFARVAALGHILAEQQEFGLVLGGTDIARNQFAVEIDKHHRRRGTHAVGERECLFSGLLALEFGLLCFSFVVVWFLLVLRSFGILEVGHLRITIDVDRIQQELRTIGILDVGLVEDGASHAFAKRTVVHFKEQEYAFLALLTGGLEFGVEIPELGLEEIAEGVTRLRLRGYGEYHQERNEQLAHGVSSLCSGLFLGTCTFLGNEAFHRFTGNRALLLGNHFTVRVV